MSAPCRRNTSRLVALLSGSLRPRAAERLREHLQRCPGCAQAFERMQKTSALCRSIGAEPAPPLPWRQIEAQVSWRLREETASRSRPRALRWLPVATGLTAALVLGGILGVLFDRHGNPRAPKLVTTPIVRPAPARPAPIPDEELAAVVTLAQGDVSVVSSKGKAHALLPARPLLQGERVLTAAGRVALQWEHGTGALVGENSEVELHRLHVLEQELDLWRGQLRVAVSPRGPEQSFSVVAGDVRARVLGTFFEVTLGEREVAVEVHEGKVLLESLSGRFPPLEVPAGMSVQVPRRGTEQRPSLASGSGRSRPSSLNLLPWPSFQRVMAGTGLLELESVPSGADVVFDARAVGTTNLTLRGGLGRHQMELWRGGKLLRKQWVEIELTPGRLALDVTPRLSPRPARLPAEIHEVFRSRAVQIQACYERRLKNDPTLEGQLTLRVEVDKSGHVARATLDTDTLSDPSVGQCALATVRRWQFPGGTESELVYPFQFRPR